MNRIGKRAAAFLLALLLLIPADVPGTGTVTGGAAAAASAGSKVKTLKSGSRGDEVKRLQLRLIELGYDPGSADGSFGKGTKDAVQEFQKRNGLDADGIAGPLTQEKLYSDTAVGIPLPDPTDVLAGRLPILVNKTHPAGELYPANLVLLKDALDPALVKIKYDDIQAVREVAEALEKMLKAAREEGVTKWQVSAGFRSYTLQERTLESKISAYLRSNRDWSRKKARSAALRTVAEPGYSEHQTGLAIDINVPGTSFSGTKQCKWLHAHCWEYGFIVRYTAEKKAITGYDAESWHIRYVGVDHALRIRDLGLCLEEYLDGIADGTIELPEAEADEPETPEPEADGQETPETDGETETETIEEILLPD